MDVSYTNYGNLQNIYYCLRDIEITWINVDGQSKFLFTDENEIYLIIKDNSLQMRCLKFHI